VYERKPGGPGGSTGTGRREFLRRAAVAGTLGWVIPTVLSVQPAAAAGSCTVVLDWDTFTVGSVFSSATVGGVTVSLSVAALPGTTLLATNRTVRAAPNGSFNQRALQFQQLPNNVGIGQTITFTFSRSVRNVTFSLYDIDNLTGGWGDRIQMVTSGYTSTAPSGSTVIGDGTAGSPFRNSQSNNNLADTSNQGNLDLTYAGPISSFAFVYRNGTNTGGSNMRIGLSDIRFDIC
jgi:hypothetical protein